MAEPDLFGAEAPAAPPMSTSPAAPLAERLRLHKTELASNNRGFLAPIVADARALIDE